MDISRKGYAAFFTSAADQGRGNCGKDKNNGKQMFHD
jgi:hypothetical protein